jgi:capsular exopolysaccharide synthesis family protein
VAVPEAALEYLYDEPRSDLSGAAVDVRAIWSALYRNRYLLLAIIALAMALALGKALLTAPIYEATATIQIDQQTARILESQDEEPATSSQETERFLQTQVDVIKSRSLAVRVSDSLRVPQNKRAVAALLGDDPELQKASAEQLRLESVEALMEGLVVALPKNSRVVAVSFNSQDPVFAAQVANSYTENTITGNLQRRFDTSAYSRTFLQEQLARAKQRLEESERQVVAYARSAGLLDTGAGVASAGANSAGSATPGGTSLTTSSLVQVNQAYSQARSARVAAEQRWASAQATPALSLVEVLSNPTIQQLTQRRAEQEATLSEERQRRLEGHPAVIQAAARVAELDQQIATIAGRIKSSLREQYIVALKQEQGLQASVGQLKGATLSEQDRSVQYNILKREADTNRQLYDGLLQRYRELSAAAGITSNNISVVDRAVAPDKPVWPRPILNLAIGTLFGLLIALGAVFLREKFDDAIRSPEDVDRKLNLPLLGTIPLLKAGTTPSEALEDPRSLLSEAHYAARLSLELSSGDGLPATLLLTSSRQAEGKSTSSYAIARDLAASGKRVLLVDGDLRKPSLHRIVGVENRRGLGNILARQESLAAVLRETAVEGLFFISSGPAPPNPAQLLTSTSLDEFLAEARAQYDITVIDGPPVLGLADAPRLAEAAQATLFVVEANGAHHGHAKAALRRLRASKANLIGVLLTKFDARKAGYGAGYGYSYYNYGVSGEDQRLSS